MGFACLRKISCEGNSEKEYHSFQIARNASLAQLALSFPKQVVVVVGRRIFQENVTA
jgi:hypothetical protein